MPAPLLPAPLLALDLEPVLEILAITAFVLIPIVRTIMDDKKKKKKQGPAGQPAPRGRTRKALDDLRRDGEDLWERLLRGEEIRPSEPGARRGQAPAPRPRSAAAEMRAPASPAREPARRPAVPDLDPEHLRRSPPQISLEQEPAGDLVEIEHLQASDLGAKAAGARVPSEVGIELAAVPSERGEAPDSLELPALASAGAAVVSDSDSGALQRLEKLGAGVSWRQAIVLAEVLGPPVGMRGPEGLGRPPAST